jgi:hypothetical protein
VEDAEVVLIGVSRAYKESTNCRLEAQYAMQREVDTVPLMLVDGYQADGWLGMLIGTRMWYGFYGAAVSDVGLFEGKIEELCRELGDRGRANVVPVPSVSSRRESRERSVLEGMRLSELKQRAIAAGVDGETVDGVDGADDPKGALIGTLLALPARAGAGVGARRRELERMKLSALKQLAVAVGADAGHIPLHPII